MPLPHEYLIKSIYFAPRGRKRIHELGAHLAQRYLSAEDSLIGVIGDAGAGKSVLIQGMFPGLELTNDDMGINVRPLPLLHHYDNGIFEHHSYHLDIHFEQAFTRPPLLAEAVHKALREGCRVIVEHFDLLYPVLKINARVLVGIGQEVVIARPGLFGPYPDVIREHGLPVALLSPHGSFRRGYHPAGAGAAGGAAAGRARRCSQRLYPPLQPPSLRRAGARRGAGQGDDRKRSDDQSHRDLPDHHRRGLAALHRSAAASAQHRGNRKFSPGKRVSPGSPHRHLQHRREGG
ncbi:MAG: hypothetical protein ACOX30_09830 [Dethiobacteria bacterium]